ncbi:MAG: hypothetical protein HY818_00675 [Acetobacterium woodii]|nr:hypothetical protein [Acetobacterium woodii]
MEIRIKEKLKNQKGSSLAFVLIIGMVILMMVASLLAVANSDFTFTQQTVESRQAYIDAKSVIEFGKIEIKTRENNLKQLRDKVNASKDEAELKTNITALENTISNYESNPAVIYGNVDNVAATLSFQGGANELGKVILEEQVAGTTNTSGTTSSQSANYIFKVETENLRRLLDYKIDFDYVKTTTTGTSGSFVIPTVPLAPVTPTNKPADNSGMWTKTEINVTSWPTTQCIIYENPNLVFTSKNKVLDVGATDKSIRIDKFSWANDPILNLNAKNICINTDMPTGNTEGASFNITATDELRFEGSYKQGYNQNKINKLKAKTIIFEQGLEIGSNTGIDIECETLWIKGDFIVNTNNKVILNRIKAKNIIIENVSNQKDGNLTINGASVVQWENLENLWVEGNLNFDNWSAANNIENKISAKNIIINETQNNKNGGLNVSSHSKINLLCSENLWVKSIDIETNDLSLVSNIKAAQIIIDGTKSKKDGSVIIGDKTDVIWDVTNYWLNGDMTTKSTKSTQEFRNITYLSAGNLNLDDDSQLSITGAANKKNHMVVGAIRPVNSNDIHLNISNLCSFTCAGLALNWDSSLVLDASIIKINGDFNLDGMKSPIELTCEYFDCSGKTTINNLQGIMNFNQKNNELNLRFYGGYQQNNSTVNINSADKVIFGSPGNGKGNSYGNDGDLILTQYNPHTLKLNVKADAIYFDTNTINFPSTPVDFVFSGKNSANTAIFNIKTQVLGKVGDYTNVSGNTIQSLPVTSTTYTAPTWPDPLNCPCTGGGSSTTVTITDGLEEYYKGGV